MNNLIPRVKRYTSNATLAWEALNGVFAVYKPPVVTYCNTRDTIILRLCKDLNNMHVRKPIKHVTIEGSTIENMNVVLKPSYADHILVVGPRYQNKDIKITCANYLAKDISGLMICGINRGSKNIQQLNLSQLPSSYRIKGLLGQATDNYFYTGRIVEKATYKFVKRKIIDQLCASMQAAHQKTMFELCGVDIQSQAAFELAAQGLVRPIDKKIPMIYSIKCIDFTPPEFTLEVVSINEDDMYLKSLIHDLGMQLHSVATCTQIQCFRYALFDLNLALLKKHWSLQNILDNIEQCHDIFSKNQMLLKQNNPILTE
ncbi:mitochondrial mRNA pseudouridine synthase Trub2 isoform X1 [Odontomachus brunneus]|uniref:mitochondrial mRNA pseudouridine synthase Trub2 isoform X1 n=1 Tax=Odontomachus brunneus TaxID=486640 RepID=UPI0013F22025|nr:mitochondrial mRNA pseudouridine synthase Trub2 isoform X1 [Odontomachus brunneus]XP_032668405.1 mitochondrial mRNA pseudouridine synthase Trub2 isoform X1 [Odontomachus brunneus]XP_032668406.1 mitochondrial mRNA pseudouridine synthase Trub2 isoform X1 [Odontomachus brunneus]XP_032668407.1 mitochondrial mRNA pseudouridine synthase Trub2 isoform X1 [Odontomachus brunneus]XP_032668408.1 mitochondrial mRNA pseudouridine synthase Trub2 isoform X1 [Odontomachus brunneus]XP_032668409.1 mitochondr